MRFAKERIAQVSQFLFEFLHEYSVLDDFHAGAGWRCPLPALGLHLDQPGADRATGIPDPVEVMDQLGVVNPDVRKGLEVRVQKMTDSLGPLLRPGQTQGREENSPDLRLGQHTLPRLVGLPQGQLQLVKLTEVVSTQVSLDQRSQSGLLLLQ